MKTSAIQFDHSMTLKALSPTALSHGANELYCCFSIFCRLTCSLVSFRFALFAGDGSAFVALCLAAFDFLRADENEASWPTAVGLIDGLELFLLSSKIFHFVRFEMRTDKVDTGWLSAATRRKKAHLGHGFHDKSLQASDAELVPAGQHNGVRRPDVLRADVAEVRIRWH